ncbi:unnamed protein product [Phytomonas sp. Hart1]|nr:unnamed protein product [Phytomonas sp. Hart1]|eukprot:CCW67067.1 unnamed protein product [Phytomonas sp. isolate Hart1]
MQNNGNNNTNSARVRNSSSPGGSGRTSPGGHRRTSTGRRSPNSYYERTTTVRFVHASTGHMVCTKLNRVQHTKCKIEDAVCLCENFLKGHCESGSSCLLAHVPNHYLWYFLTPRVNPNTFVYQQGFNIRCYTPNMDAYYDIPSNFIYQTHGSERYIVQFNDNGDNFREKYRLCSTLLRTGYCENGYNCEDVHCCVSDMSAFPCIHTHIADSEAVKNYERLPANIRVRVFQPNSGDEGQDFPGNDVLRTAGATQYEEAYNREGNVPTVKMQHCAHFQNKKLCRLGDGCRFLHVVSMALSVPMEEETVDTSPYQTPVDKEALEKQFAVQTNKNNAAYLAATVMIDDMVDNSAKNSLTPYYAAANPIGYDNAGSKISPAMVSPNILPSTPANTAMLTSGILNSATAAAPQKDAQPRDRRSPVRRHNPYLSSSIEMDNGVD